MGELVQIDGGRLALDLGLSIPAAWAHDRVLTHADLGVLVRLVSLPPDQPVKLADLAKMSATGLDGTRAAINRLVDAGYVSRGRVFEQGRQRGTIYQVHQ